MLGNKQQKAQASVVEMRRNVSTKAISLKHGADNANKGNFDSDRESNEKLAAEHVLTKTSNEQKLDEIQKSTASMDGKLSAIVACLNQVESWLMQKRPRKKTHWLPGLSRRSCARGWMIWRGDLAGITLFSWGFLNPLKTAVPFHF